MTDNLYLLAVLAALGVTDIDKLCTKEQLCEKRRSSPENGQQNLLINLVLNLFISFKEFRRSLEIAQI